MFTADQAKKLSDKKNGKGETSSLLNRIKDLTEEGVYCLPISGDLPQDQIEELERLGYKIHRTLGGQFGYEGKTLISWFGGEYTLV